MHDGAADAINSSSGGSDVSKDWILADDVIFCCKKKFRFAPNFAEALLEIVKLSGGVIQVTGEKKEGVIRKLRTTMLCKGIRA